VADLSGAAHREFSFVVIADRTVWAELLNGASRGELLAAWWQLIRCMGMSRVLRTGDASLPVAL
jgi:hypothetical protein